MQRRLLYITAHARLVHVVAINYAHETNILTRLCKSTSSIGCVGAESNAPVDSNAGEPSRCAICIFVVNDYNKQNLKCETLENKN